MKESLVDRADSAYLKRKIHTQKLLQPVGLCLPIVDSEAMDSSASRQVTLSGLFERVGLTLSTPEDNLKKYPYPLVVCYAFLVGGVVASLSLPALFLAALREEANSPRCVLYWLFWSSLIELALAFLFLLRKTASKASAATSQFWLLATHGELFQLCFNALLYFCVISGLLVLCHHVENLVLINCQALALGLRCCCKLGRNISLTPATVRGLAFLFAGTSASLFLFSLWRPEYNVCEGALAIASAFCGGVLWLRNREVTSSITPCARISLLTAANALLSFFFSGVLYSFHGFGAFLSKHLVVLLFFSSLRMLAQWLKARAGRVFEDLIPALAALLEPVLLFSLYGIGHALATPAPLTKLFELVPQLGLIVVLLLAGQCAVLIEIKKNEVNLEGGKLGFRIAQRDWMKEKHFEMLERLHL